MKVKSSKKRAASAAFTLIELPAVRKRKCAAFTLIELLTVVMIIGVLAGLVFTAATAARKRAHIAVAQAEVRSLSKAWKSYWQTYKEWPPGYYNTEKEMDGSAMKILLADPGRPSGTNPQGLKFMDVPLEAIIDGFRDPWGEHYWVDFRQKSSPGIDYYETTVHFPNRRRFDYE